MNRSSDKRRHKCVLADLGKSLGEGMDDNQLMRTSERKEPSLNTCVCAETLTTITLTLTVETLSLLSPYPTVSDAWLSDPLCFPTRKSIAKKGDPCG